jgi:hypothetical protein
MCKDLVKKLARLIDKYDKSIRDMIETDELVNILKQIKKEMEELDV